MLSWCPIKGPAPPGGYESRRGLLLVDSSVREALDFEAKLHGYSTALREGGRGEGAGGFAWMVQGRSDGWAVGVFAGKRSSGIKALTVLCIDVQVESIRKRSTPAYHLLFQINTWKCVYFGADVIYTCYFFRQLIH